MSKAAASRKVRVNLDSRAYDVLIGKGVLDRKGHWAKGVGLAGPVAVITDSTVAELYAKKVLHQLTAAGFQPALFSVPAGEKSKSMEAVATVLSGLAQKKLTRSAAVIGLGGGVIGDLAGFVAATYLRGIDFVQVPTTLLAMVDSSVGGKTGVNLPEGKNLVGAFLQPKLVVADLETLKTLPPREFAAGMAEVIKYGAIRDRALFNRVAKGVKPGDSDLVEIVKKCVAIKARIVEKDEFEIKGERALLNFGHTIGHAIEKVTEYRNYLHGEAISLGMRAAAWLSHWEAGLPLKEVQILGKTLQATGLPTHLKEPDDSVALILIDRIIQALGNDKKVAADGKNRWVLLKSLGQAETGFEIKPDVIEAALRVLLTPLLDRDVP
ncbi:MAG: 3-dehydroquinate synthase [Methylacidiphilales bacterium]|nr:3-dehydroquinate synthase [Candidatus Methylacidiphilales bacterium]